MGNAEKTNQFLPPKATGTRLPEHTTHEQGIAAWIDLMRSTDKIMLARFTEEVGADRAEEAYRVWWNARVRQPVPHKERLIRRLNSGGEENAD